MATKTERKGYSGLQIALHWAVAALVLIQFLADEPISQAWRALRRGDAAVETGSGVLLHIACGVAVLLLVIWRLALRHTRGAPRLPAEEPAALRFVAAATHIGMYLLLVLLPLSGAVAWFGGVGAAGEVHEIAKTVLLVLVVLHVAGAFFQQFVLKTNILSRMAVAED